MSALPPVPQLPEISAVDQFDCGWELGRDLFIDLHEGGSQAAIIQKYSEYLADGVNGEPYLQNKAFLSGFTVALLEWIPNLKQK